MSQKSTILGPKNYDNEGGYLEYLTESDKKICLSFENQFKNKNWEGLDKLEEMDLFSLYKKLCAEYAKLFGVSHLVEGFTLTTEDKIRKLIVDEFGDSDSSLVHTITHPDRHSFLTTEQYELQKIAQTLGKLGVGVFDDSVNQKYPDIAARIGEHVNNYFWKINNFTESKVLEKSDFVKEINEFLSNMESVEGKISSYESVTEFIAQRDKLRSSIKNTELINLLKINDVIFDIHDRRKMQITKALGMIDSTLKELAKRFFIPQTDIRYLMPGEVDDLANMSKELSERRKKSICIVTGDKSQIFSGKKAGLYISQLKNIINLNSKEVIKGNIASPGKVQGVAKICRGLAELEKFKKGEILIACMTQPEFVPAMKQALAVVTDEGGLTCHAAIISRELGVPCVIGTKDATTFFKDGDIIEVDANNGVVTRIKDRNLS